MGPEGPRGEPGARGEEGPAGDKGGGSPDARAEGKVLGHDSEPDSPWPAGRHPFWLGVVVFFRTRF